MLQEILSHTDFVNSVTYNGDSGSLVASAGDDLTARVWDSSSQTQISKFLLTSPGMVSLAIITVISINSLFCTLRRLITHIILITKHTHMHISGYRYVYMIWGKLLIE